MQSVANNDSKSTRSAMMHRLWQLVDGYRLLYVVAIAATGLAALANTGIYLLLGQIVDDVLPAAAGDRLLPLALLFLLLALLQGAFSFVSGRYAAYTGEQIALRLRNFLYDHMQRLPFSYHDRMASGELLSRATSDVDTVRRLFAEQGVGIGRILFLFFVNWAALLTINVRLGLVSVVIIPALVVSSTWFFQTIQRRYESFQKQEARLTNRLQEALAGVRVVKAFARQSFEIDRFDIENSEKRDRGRDLTWAHAIFWPSTDLLTGVQLLLAYYVGARMAISGTITAGDFIAAIGLLAQIVWPIRNMGRLIADVGMALVSLGRIDEITAQQQEKIDDPNAVAPEGVPKGDLIFENVSFHHGEEPILHDISFELKAGQTVALLGATGSGKTSLVNLLPRFYDYSSGRILLDGIELTNYARSYLRRHIGIVMQEPFLFAESVRDNIIYGVDRAIDQATIFEAAKAAAVHDVIEGFPKGYDTLVGERGVTLSGGQKQRLTLARTILQNPRILILDDATSAIDTETEARVREALQQLAQQRTTLLIAHRVQSVVHADLILVLDQGRIIERGTHRELLAQNGTYRRIYDLQAMIESDLQAEIDVSAATDVPSHNGHHRSLEPV